MREEREVMMMIIIIRRCVWVVCVVVFQMYCFGRRPAGGGERIIIRNIILRRCNKRERLEY